MSIVRYSENAQNLQIYNNAAFDDAGDGVKGSWLTLQPISVHPSEALEFDSSKENRRPRLDRSPDGADQKRVSLNKPVKLLFKQGLLPPTQQQPEPNSIDNEIEEIEKEINWLSSRLEALRIEKAGREQKPCCRRQSVGRVIPAKFMDAKQGARTPVPASPRRRGVSLGPSEIVSPGGSLPPDARRKSCFLKLPEIEEEGEKGGRSLSLSPGPRSRPSIRKVADSRRGISTVGSKKTVRRDPAAVTCLQPKSLFKSSKNSRVVPSRYGQTTCRQGERDDEGKRRPRGNAGSGSRTPAPEGKASKRTWNVPAARREESPSTILRMAKELPSIKTLRCGSGSPRDSGPAKRVADLIGKKSYFEGGEGEMADASIRQVLAFDQEE